MVPGSRPCAAGRTFVTDGPLLSLIVDGHGPGSVVSAPEEGKTMHVHAEAQSGTAFDRLEVLHDGRPLAVAEAAGDPHTATIEVEAPVITSGWLAARCWGGDRGSLVRAHTVAGVCRGSGPASSAGRGCHRSPARRPRSYPGLGPPGGSLCNRGAAPAVGGDDGSRPAGTTAALSVTERYRSPGEQRDTAPLSRADPHSDRPHRGRYAGILLA